jgi:hypothetical protein
LVDGIAGLLRFAFVPNIRHNAAASSSVHVLNTQYIPGTHPHTQSTVVGSQRAEALNYLTVNLDGDQSLTIVVEPAGRARLTHQAAFERHRGIGCKSKQETPQRFDQHPLEDKSAKQSGCNEHDSTQKRPRNHSCETKAYQ